MHALTACTIGGVMQPGAGTTVERQVAGEFGDRSPVLKVARPPPHRADALDHARPADSAQRRGCGDDFC